MQTYEFRSTHHLTLTLVFVIDAEDRRDALDQIGRMSDAGQLDGTLKTSIEPYEPNERAYSELVWLDKGEPKTSLRRCRRRRRRIGVVERIA